jgi:hypothetical protein
MSDYIKQGKKGKNQTVGSNKKVDPVALGQCKPQMT